MVYVCMYASTYVKLCSSESAHAINSYLNSQLHSKLDLHTHTHTCWYLHTLCARTDIWASINGKRICAHHVMYYTYIHKHSCGTSKCMQANYFIYIVKTAIYTAQLKAFTLHFPATLVTYQWIIVVHYQLLANH